ncbi:hypothetical protein GCM10022279_14040 [Comamonas faecalis]|uniref:DUF4845 domain-containing protein n=1 Tax=Comamonas faecalis TaxID=1387849 RepID=A0ABP7R3I3_9BURK
MQPSQRTTARARQRGLSFIGVILFGAVAVAAFAIGAQSVPIFMEYGAIKKAARKASGEGDTVAQIRASFDRSAQIDDFTSVTGRDLEITKHNDRVIVSFNYEREVPLFGPAYLVYRFQDSTR